MSRAAKAWLAAAIAALVLLFVVQNTDVVAVRFMFWSLQMSRVVLILMTLVAGMALGALLLRLYGGPRR